MVTTKLNLSMTEPQVRQIYAKQGDTGRVLDVTLDQTPEDGTLRILRPDGTEVTSEAVTGGEVSESGETVTFESMTEADVTELTVGIEPVQDLNGYDAPWVGGAGVNKLPYASSGTVTNNGITMVSNGDGTYTVSGTTSSSSANVYFDLLGEYTLADGDYFYAWNDVANAGASINFDKAGGGNLAYFSIVPINRTLQVSSNIVGQAVGRIRIYVAANTTISVTIKPMIANGGSQTSWTPYSNICPITGHDEVTVFDTAEQMYDPSQVVIGRNWTGGSSDNRAVFEFVPTPNISYEIVTAGGNFSDILFLQMNGGTQLSNTQITPSTTPKTVTIAENCNRVIIQFNKNSAITTSDFLDFECSVSTKTTTYTTSLGQTVYGGTLDMVSGVLTVDKAMVDLGSLTWTISGGGGGLFNTTGLMGSIKPVAWSTEVVDAICSAYVAHTGDSVYRKAYEGSFGADNNGRLYVYDGTKGSLDVTAFKNALVGTQLCYELATPQTVQLASQQIKTLVGTNNVWASSGDIINITFTYGGLLSELPSEATEIVGKCYCDVEQNGVSSMPFTLNVKKNERQ